MVQKLHLFCWRGGFCLLVELQRWRVCPTACAAGLFLSYNTKLFGIAHNFWPVSGNLWLWSENLLIYIIHNIIFLLNDTKISGLLNISGVCLEISSMCPEIRIHKDCATFFILLHTNFYIAQSFLCVSGNLRHVFDSFQTDTNFWSVSGNFQHVSGNFDCTKILCLFSIIWHNIFPDCLKFLACVWKFRAYIRKFPDF